MKMCESFGGMRNKSTALIAVTALTVSMALTCKADIDVIGKTPTYWYTFDGAIVSHGSSALKCTFDDSTYTFLPCRGTKKGWRVNCEKSYHAENVFAPNNGSFTIFLSIDPGAASQFNRYIFSLGNNTSTTNLAFVLMFDNRIGVARWDRTHCGSELRAYGLLATDGVAGRVHPYALVYDGTTHKLTLYSGGIACAEAPFEGFGGADGDATPFQFGSVHGGMVRPFSTVPTGSNAVGLPVIEDFRFYNEVLNPEQIAILSTELPSTWTENDAAAVGPLVNNGELPRYWYTFDGAVRSRGCSDFLSSYAVDYPEHRAPAPTSYVDCRVGAKAGSISSTTPHGDWFTHQGGSFTLFVSSTAGTTDQNILLAIGQNTSTKNLALVRQSATQVKIVKWNSTSSIDTLVTATVDSPADYVHPYVVRYSQDTEKIELFVDGYKAGEASHTGFDTINPTGYQFGSMRGGNIHGLKAYANVNLEALKFYERALTDAEITALSDEYVCGSGEHLVSDIGRYPEYWYTFGETTPKKQSYEELPLGSQNTGVLIQEGTAAFARKGSFAATELRSKTGTTVQGAYGSALDLSGTFTIFLSARVKKMSTRGILFSLGGLSDSGVNLAISADPDGNMVLSRWTYSPIGQTQLLKTTGLDAETDFHPYAVVWDGALLRFYVDGIEVGTSSNFADFTQKKFQFGAIHGGIDSRLNFVAGRYALEDFRIYKTALTADQVATLSARYVKWPKGALVWNGGTTGSWDYTTVNWLVWDAVNWQSSAQAFTSGASALFDLPVSGLNVTESIVANDVRFEANSFWATVNRVRCNSLTIPEDVLVVPANVTSPLTPGVPLFYGYAAATFPVDYRDSYENAYYQNDSGTALYFGKRGGFAVIIR